MNRQVKVSWTTLRITAHYFMVHARVLEVYIHFSILYATDHIFLVISIKDPINEDGEPTTTFTLATGTKPSVSNLRVLFCPCVVRKDTAHVEKKGLNIRHQAQNVLRYLCWMSIASKRVYFVRTEYNKTNIFI